jgi:nucleoside 2-deoxyribosyltransferase
MADGFWKALRTKLVETGLAYAQQVRVVNELKQLSPEDAQERFREYVRGLSSTARAGFTVTLAALANNERNAEAKRFIEALRAMLTNPTAALPLAPAASAPPPAAPTQSLFDEDVQRASDWRELEGKKRDEVVDAYLRTLQVDALDAFRINLEQMKLNCAANLKNHRENEVRIVGGRFIEDQMTYRMLLRSTGRHDPDWLRQLQVLDGWGRWFDELHQLVCLVIKQRLEPATPPPAPELGVEQTEIDALKLMLEQQLRSGEVRGERAVALQRALKKIEAVLASANRGEIKPAQADQRLKLIYTDVAPLIADPGPKARLASGSPRLKEVDAYAGAMKAALGRELMESTPAATATALGAVLGDLLQFQQLAANADDDALAQLEHDLLRPAARSRHELSMARHPLIARPLWESHEYMPQVNAIAYSGAQDLQQQLEAALAGRQLAVHNPKRSQNHGQSRWDQLNGCHLAMFDLRGASKIAALATSAPKRGRELTAAAYELGLAFALGKPLVVIGDAGEAMPFDIDVAPLALDGGADDAARLQQAVDEAFYVPQRSDNDSSIAESVAFLDRLTDGHEKRKGFEGMGWLDPALAKDPAEFVAGVDRLLRALPAPPWRLLRPGRPAAYPDETQRRCFHVMPFGPDWANEVRDVTRAACKKRSFVYRRGDEAEEGRIIRAIWDDLCRASIVLIDLTGANLNVMIELGIAHAIGRPVLAVQRRDAVDVRPKHIEKLRVLPYQSPAELKGLLLAKLPG